MELLHLQSEDALYFYLKKFLKAKPDAVQLDGSTKKKGNAKVLLVFTYSVNGRKYKLSGDFSRKAAEQFVQLTEEHGSSGAVLKEQSEGDRDLGLVFATSGPAGKKADGFRCLPYTYKASDKLKDAA